MSQIIQISALTALLGLTGCSVMEPISLAEQQSDQLTPYTETLTLKGGEKHLANSKIELAKFIERLTPQSMSQVVTMNLYSGEGVRLQGYARQHLLAAGVPPSNIRSQDLSMHYNPSRGYDFSLKAVKYNVVLTECKATRVEDFYKAGNGCFVEAAYTQSLVKPQSISNNKLNR